MRLSCSQASPLVRRSSHVPQACSYQRSGALCSTSSGMHCSPRRRQGVQRRRRDCLRPKRRLTSPLLVCGQRCRLAKLPSRRSPLRCRLVPRVLSSYNRLRRQQQPCLRDRSTSLAPHVQLRGQVTVSASSLALRRPTGTEVTAVPHRRNVTSRSGLATWHRCAAHEKPSARVGAAEPGCTMWPIRAAAATRAALSSQSSRAHASLGTRRAAPSPPRRGRRACTSPA